MGLHRSTYHRWKSQVQRAGLEMLRPRERPRPQMPNQLPVMVERRIVAFRTRSSRAGRGVSQRAWRGPEWRWAVVSPNGVYKTLVRHGLNTRAKRVALVAGCRAHLRTGAARRRNAGRRLERVLSDNGNEFGRQAFGSQLPAGGHAHPDSLRSAADQRARRTAAPHHPRRMLAARLWTATFKSAIAACAATSHATCTTTTTTANTTDASPTADAPPSSSTMPARCSPMRHLSAQLGVCSD
jgi:hypothetical protein